MSVNFPLTNVPEEKNEKCAISHIDSSVSHGGLLTEITVHR